MGYQEVADHARDSDADEDERGRRGGSPDSDWPCRPPRRPDYDTWIKTAGYPAPKPACAATPMGPEEIARLRALADAATPGLEDIYGPIPDADWANRDDAEKIASWVTPDDRRLFVEARSAVLSLVAALEAERARSAELLAERNDARAWVRRLTATERVLTCVYCGKAYPPGAPDHSADVLTAHIRTCEKHPMRALLDRCAALELLEAAKPAEPRS